MTREEWINKAKKTHGSKYDYSNVEYKNSSEKVCIICPKHGEFWQRSNDHLQGRGCPACNIDKRKSNTDDFIKQAKYIHSDKYDYSKVCYKTSLTKVCIICPKHGEFWQKPASHLRGSGCPVCNPKRKKSNSEVIDDFISVHGNTYDYSKVNYINATTKVCIICPKHGEFWQEPHSHLKGRGCPKCSKEIKDNNQKLTQEEWINRALKIHGNKYNYSKVEYKGCYEKVCIVCPKHGEFWQNANTHIKGSGCPKCKNSTLENKVLIFLEKNNIEYIYQYFPKFLNNGNGHQSLDFYLPEYNIAIECQGEQHYKPVEAFGGYEQFLKRVRLDKKKFELCIKNGINILYFSQCKARDKNAISSLKTLLDEIRKNPKQFKEI